MIQKLFWPHNVYVLLNFRLGQGGVCSNPPPPPNFCWDSPKNDIFDWHKPILKLRENLTPHWPGLTGPGDKLFLSQIKFNLHQTFRISSQSSTTMVYDVKDDLILQVLATTKIIFAVQLRMTPSFKYPVRNPQPQSFIFPESLQTYNLRGWIALKKCLPWFSHISVTIRDNFEFTME